MKVNFWMISTIILLIVVFFAGYNDCAGNVVKDIVYKTDTIYLDNCSCPDCYEEVISDMVDNQKFEITIKEMMEDE